MSHVLLSHLSKENNEPQLAANLFIQQAGDVKVVVASRYTATEVFRISGNQINQPVKSNVKPQQLGLFAEM